jgi:glycine cleavage system H protein
MTLLLVPATIAVFLTIDFFYSKAKHQVVQIAPAMSKTGPATAAAEAESDRRLLRSRQPPLSTRTHQGIGREPSLVRIGMDDFAAKLTGNIAQVPWLQRGQWIRQGHKVWRLVRYGVRADMVSPIQGSVADINEAAVTDPSLISKDPYGEGWMVTVQSPHPRRTPQPADGSTGAVVDRRVLVAASTPRPERSRSVGPGWRNGHGRHCHHDP